MVWSLQWRPLNALIRKSNIIQVESTRKYAGNPKTKNPRRKSFSFVSTPIWDNLFLATVHISLSKNINLATDFMATVLNMSLDDLIKNRGSREGVRYVLAVYKCVAFQKATHWVIPLFKVPL